MSKDTQNAVLVLLSIVVVLVIVIGGGYWCLNYGEDIFNRVDRENKTIVPNKKTKLENGEYVVSLDDEKIQTILTKLNEYKTEDMLVEGNIYKVASAKNVITSTEDRMDIYEYYVYKELPSDTNPMFNYYSNNTKENLIISIVEEIDDTIFNDYSDSVGLNKYVFVFDKVTNEYVFKNIEKVK